MISPKDRFKIRVTVFRLLFTPASVSRVSAMLSFSSKKNREKEKEKEREKERERVSAKPYRFLPDSTQRGALCWQVVLEDSGQSALVDCFLAISADSLVLIEERTCEIVFVTPCASILGWATQGNR